MRKNYAQAGRRAEDNRTYLEGDWYSQGIPSNVTLAQNVFIDSSYGFAAFRSKQTDALFIDEASGCYDRASFIVSEHGKIAVGKFCILNGSTLICNEQISIGDHCMFAWGSVISDTWLNKNSSVTERQNILINIPEDSTRNFPFPSSKPVVIEDNVWIGFDAVILPGVRLGRGCVVGCKTIVDTDVPPYAVITGSPARIVKYLNPNDTEEAKEEAMKQCIK